MAERRLDFRVSVLEELVRNLVAGALGSFTGLLHAFTSGSGAPSDGTGNDGDWYVDTDTQSIYLKSGGTWLLVR